jgi:hypothetical protein
MYSILPGQILIVEELGQHNDKNQVYGCRTG